MISASRNFRLTNSPWIDLEPIEWLPHSDDIPSIRLAPQMVRSECPVVHLIMWIYTHFMILWFLLPLSQHWGTQYQWSLCQWKPFSPPNCTEPGSRLSPQLRFLWCRCRCTGEFLQHTKEACWQPKSLFPNNEKSFLKMQLKSNINNLMNDGWCHVPHWCFKLEILSESSVFKHVINLGPSLLSVAKVSFL